MMRSEQWKSLPWSMPFNNHSKPLAGTRLQAGVVCVHLSVLAATERTSGQFSDMLWPALQRLLLSVLGQ